jgi:hypothetical protein
MLPIRYSRYGYLGGIGTAGVLLAILIIYLLLGRGGLKRKFP